MSAPEFQFWNDSQYQSFERVDQRHLQQMFTMRAFDEDTVKIGNNYELRSFGKVLYGSCFQVNLRTGFQRHVRVKPPYAVPNERGVPFPLDGARFQYWDNQWVDYPPMAQAELLLAAQCCPPPSSLMLFVPGKHAKEYVIEKLDGLVDGIKDDFVQTNRHTRKQRKVRLLAAGDVQDDVGPAGKLSVKFIAFEGGNGMAVPPELQIELCKAWKQLPRPSRVQIGNGVAVAKFDGLEAGAAELHIPSRPSPVKLELRLHPRPGVQQGSLELPRDLDREDLPWDAFGQYLSNEEAARLAPGRADGGECVICFDNLASPENAAAADNNNNNNNNNMMRRVFQLRCNHAYHDNCLQRCFQERRRCPQCMQSFGKMIGKQPGVGTMRWWLEKKQHDGHKGHHHAAEKFIVVEFHFPDGVDNDGKPYQGRGERGLLLHNTEGAVLLELFKVAFRRQVMFGLGVRNKGETYGPTFNIHMKTSRHGGEARHGYPDEGYFHRCLAELKENGVGIADLPLR